MPIAEFVPASHQYLLTTLSVFWSIGQLVGSLVRISPHPIHPDPSLTPTPQIAWPLISNFSCASPAACPRASNQGWRYFTYTVGGLVMVLFVLRFFVFHLYESPRYLVGRGRDAEAVDVLHRVAAYNGRESRLTVGMLAAAGEAARRKMGESADVDEVRDEKGKEKEVGAVRAGLAASRQVFSGKHVKALFATRKLALSTTLLILMWGTSSVSLFLYASLE